MLLLGQRMDLPELLGIALVIAASIGAVTTMSAGRDQDRALALGQSG
jgi:threonine/homoserine efflux transporter RhtA